MCMCNEVALLPQNVFNGAKGINTLGVSHLQFVASFYVMKNIDSVLIST